MAKRKAARWVKTRRIAHEGRSVELEVPTTTADWVAFAREAVELHARVQQRRESEAARTQRELDEFAIAADRRTRAMGYVIGRDGEVHVLGAGPRSPSGWIGSPTMRQLLGR